MSDDDEDALHWAGDEERGQVAPRRSRGVEPPNDTEGDLDELDPQPSGTPGYLLVVYGILAGTYGIFTLGWITIVLAGGTTLPSLPAEIMYQLGEFLAIALPPLWFIAVLWLERRPPRRLLWLLIGIPIVVPWPWVLSQ